MSGEGREAATGAAEVQRPGADFGPCWPEVQKDTYMRKSAKGVE